MIISVFHSLTKGMGFLNQRNKMDLYCKELQLTLMD